MAAVKATRIAAVTISAVQGGSPKMYSKGTSTRVTKVMSENVEPQQVAREFNGMNSSLATIERKLSSIPFSGGMYFKDQSFVPGVEVNIAHKMSVPCRYFVLNTRDGAGLIYRPASNETSTTNLILRSAATCRADIYIYPEV